MFSEFVSLKLFGKLPPYMPSMLTERHVGGRTAYLCILCCVCISSTQVVGGWWVGGTAKHTQMEEGAKRKFFFRICLVSLQWLLLFGCCQCHATDDALRERQSTGIRLVSLPIKYYFRFLAISPLRHPPFKINCALFINAPTTSLWILCWDNIRYRSSTSASPSKLRSVALQWLHFLLRPSHGYLCQGREDSLSWQRKNCFPVNCSSRGTSFLYDDDDRQEATARIERWMQEKPHWHGSRRRHFFFFPCCYLKSIYAPSSPLSCGLRALYLLEELFCRGMGRKRKIYQRTSGAEKIFSGKEGDFDQFMSSF